MFNDNMSTPSIIDPNIYYSEISTQLYTTLGSILIITGTVGSISCCTVFAEKTMRPNPASVYFIAYNIANLIRLWQSLFLSLMSYHGFDPINRHVFFCKIHFYIQLVLFMLTPYYLILTSIDRTLVTSSNKRIRERSTLRLTYRSIAGVTVVFFLFFIQLFAFVNIHPIYPNVFICYLPAGTYRLFMSICAFVLNGFLPSVLLTIFGMLTLRNLRRGRILPANVGPIINNARRLRDRQFAVMLLAETISYIPFNFSYHLFSLYRQITNDRMKSRQQQAIELFLVSTFYLFTFIPSTLSFYLYLAVSKSFRQKANQVLFKLCHHRPIHNNQRSDVPEIVVVSH